MYRSWVLYLNWLLHFYLFWDSFTIFDIQTFFTILYNERGKNVNFCNLSYENYPIANSM